jgi:hypothetical protein
VRREQVHHEQLDTERFAEIGAKMDATARTALETAADLAKVTVQTAAVLAKGSEQPPVG